MEKLIHKKKIYIYIYTKRGRSMEDGSYPRTYFSSCYKKLDYQYLRNAYLKKKKFSLRFAPTISDKTFKHF